MERRDRSRSNTEHPRPFPLFSRNCSALSEFSILPADKAPWLTTTLAQVSAFTVVLVRAMGLVYILMYGVRLNQCEPPTTAFTSYAFFLHRCVKN